ncbi:Thioredoxin-like protein [Cucumis melo var. makuwa]|uniref:Thioredoxin-like protein n=1 Tax=Cucumis melo var. makuwa TaxID=1194695 RepID=A0A5A7VE75_CUCMM|nr:Thioredoxin-like protein [Cucumis melo var. makuwa]
MFETKSSETLNSPTRVNSSPCYHRRQLLSLPHRARASRGTLTLLTTGTLPARDVRPSESLSTSTSVGTKENEDRGLSSSSSSPFSPPPNFKPPEPKRFGVRPDKVLDVLGASLFLIFRLGTGIFVHGYSVSLVPKNDFPPDKYALEIAGFKVKETSKLGPRPEKPIEIYEFERYIACSVREIVAVLDLDILFYPCPRNGPNFHPKVLQMGGKQQFPYMVMEMYLFPCVHVGDGNKTFDDIVRRLCYDWGSIYKPSKLPPAPLEIWAYEGFPFCKLVREVLVELELPHLGVITKQMTAIEEMVASEYN